MAAVAVVAEEPSVVLPLNEIENESGVEVEISPSPALQKSPDLVDDKEKLADEDNNAESEEKAPDHAEDKVMLATDEDNADSKEKAPKQDEGENANSLGKDEIQVHPMLKEHFKECLFTWIPDPEKKKFDKEEAKYYKEVVVTKFNDASPEWAPHELELNPFNIICHKLSKTFLHIVTEDFDNAARLLTEVKEDIDTAVEKKFISPRYQQGFHYVREGLEAFKLSLTLLGSGVGIEDELRRYLDNCTRYDDLLEETRTGVKAAKAYFYECIRFDREEQCRLLQEVLEADPDTIDWKLKAYAVLRLIRKEESYQAPPSSDEKEMLVKCIESKPDCAKVKLAVLMFLGDTVQRRGWNQRNGPLVLTKDLVFEDVESIQDYVENIVSSKDVKTAMEHSVETNLNVAEVLTSLPNRPESSRLAEECLKRALEMKPEGSKVNHRLGIFYRNAKRYEDAVVYCRKAYEFDKRNFPALMEVLKLMMRSFAENIVQLQTIFAEELKNEEWSEARRAKIYFLYGIFHMRGANDEQCIDAWKTGYLLDPESLDSLKNLSFLCTCFRQSFESINLDKIIRLLQSVEPGGVEQVENFVEKALANVHEALDRQRSFQNRNPRGGGGVFGQRGGGGQRGRGGGQRGRGGGGDRSNRW